MMLGNKTGSLLLSTENKYLMYTNVEALHALLIELFAPQPLVPELLLRQMSSSLRTLRSPGAKVTVKRVIVVPTCSNNAAPVLLKHILQFVASSRFPPIQHVDIIGPSVSSYSHGGSYSLTTFDRNTRWRRRRAGQCRT